MLKFGNFYWKTFYIKAYSCIHQICVAVLQDMISMIKNMLGVLWMEFFQLTLVVYSFPSCKDSRILRFDAFIKPYVSFHFQKPQTHLLAQGNLYFKRGLSVAIQPFEMHIVAWVIFMGFPDKWFHPDAFLHKILQLVTSHGSLLSKYTT